MIMQQSTNPKGNLFQVTEFPSAFLASRSDRLTRNSPQHPDEKNEKKKATIRLKAEEYMNRAEEIKKSLRSSDDSYVFLTITPLFMHSPWFSTTSGFYFKHEYCSNSEKRVGTNINSFISNLAFSWRLLTSHSYHWFFWMIKNRLWLGFPVIVDWFVYHFL